MTEPFDAVLADDLAQEIRRIDGDHSLGAGALAEALIPFLSQRIAAAHAAEVAELEAQRDMLLYRVQRESPQLYMAEARVRELEAHAADRESAAEAAERDAREAVGLLRECLPYVDSHAKASHMMDGFRRQPANDHDNLALRVAAAIATTEQADD